LMMLNVYVYLCFLITLYIYIPSLPVLHVIIYSKWYVLHRKSLFICWCMMGIDPVWLKLNGTWSINLIYSSISGLFKNVINCWLLDVIVLNCWSITFGAIYRQNYLWPQILLLFSSPWKMLAVRSWFPIRGKKVVIVV
jgi:hypothetical protein